MICTVSSHLGVAAVLLYLLRDATENWAEERWVPFGFDCAFIVLALGVGALLMPGVKPWLLRWLSTL